MSGTRKDGRPTATQMRDTDRLIERFERRPEVVSLPMPIVEATGTRHEGDGTRVRANIPFQVNYSMIAELEATVIAWTPRAVRVEAQTPDGRTVRAWLWASAVRRI